jgi:hypothetical protein
MRKRRKTEDRTPKAFIMRKLILLSSILVVVSCSTGGRVGEIDEILHGGNYRMEYEFQGCFGNGTEKLEVKDHKTAIHTFLVFSQADQLVERTKTISWTKEKEKKLKEMFEIGIHLRDTISTCTTSAKYRLSGWRKSIAFEDLNCTVTGTFEELVK